MRGRRERAPEGARIPILPTLEHYGGQVPDLERMTAMKCPFHDDRNASASVNTGDDGEFAQWFGCHGCGIKGRAEHIVMKVEGIDFQTAVERAAGYAGTSAEAVLPKRGRRSAVSGDEGADSRSRRYRRVGRGNGRTRRSREPEG